MLAHPSKTPCHHAPSRTSPTPPDAPQPPNLCPHPHPPPHAPQPPNLCPHPHQIQIAKRQGVVNPENTFFSVKRFIGRKANEVKDELKQVRAGFGGGGGGAGGLVGVRGSCLG